MANGKWDGLENIPGSRTQRTIHDRIRALLHQRLEVDSGFKLREGALDELALEIWQETRRPTQPEAPLR